MIYSKNNKTSIKLLLYWHREGIFWRNHFPRIPGVFQHSPYHERCSGLLHFLKVYLYFKSWYSEMIAVQWLNPDLGERWKLYSGFDLYVKTHSKPFGRIGISSEYFCTENLHVQFDVVERTNNLARWLRHRFTKPNLVNQFYSSSCFRYNSCFYLLCFF